MLRNKSLINIIGLCATLACLGVAYYVEWIEKIAPCPLCLLQRFAMIAVCLGFIVVNCHYWATTAVKFYASWIILWSGAGIGIAGRQVLLQHLPPDQVPSACGVSLDYLLETFPFHDAARIVLQGTAECATVPWTLFGLSMAEWSLAFFSLFIIIGLIQWIRG